MFKEYICTKMDYKRKTGSFYYTTFILLCSFLLLSSNNLFAQTLLRGVVIDAKTQETLPGVTIAIKNTTKGVITDSDGAYELQLTPGKHTITASYLSYNTIEIPDIEIRKGEATTLDIPLYEAAQSLNEVEVVAVARVSSEIAIMNTMRGLNSVASGVSAQQITKNQDKDASEVIKRISGISIMNNRYLIVRGLSQRYNNIWVNNSAMPSTEADARSFSFDIIPSSQIENILIFKSPQPELPADFSGGFVKLTTKSAPTENSLEISYGTAVNSETHFKDFKYNPGSGTDFLGFDNGLRSLRSIVPSNRLDEYNTELVDAVTRKGFNNNWQVKKKTPLPDQSFSIASNRRFKVADGKNLGMMAALNYSYQNRIFSDIKNTQYGVYNVEKDMSEPDNDYRDNQYITNARLGAILNLSLMLNNDNRIEFRNILNQLGQDRYTDRTGSDFNTGRAVRQERQEYLYSSRTTYTGQFAGKHTLSKVDNLDWTTGFSYANKNQPDRRMINRNENASTETDPYNGQFYINQGDIKRNFVKLNEYIYDGVVNYTRDLKFDSGFSPVLKAGGYAEYRTRDYKTRDFAYYYSTTNLPYSFRYGDVVNEILIPENFGADKLAIFERTDNVDSYEGNNKLYSGYVGANLPFDKLSIYTGVRAEYNHMTITNYISPEGYETKDLHYKTFDLFPSLNGTYTINKDNLLRIAYGMSTNRPEFREVSPASYYDFDLFSRIVGNPDLKSAYIHNFDIKYEFYPSMSEVISVDIFYKHFINPIEWSFNNTGGGGRIYTFENAKSADNIGIEVDMKKNLAFIGMKYFSLALNASLISSKVKFNENSIVDERPLQGQSPYLVNTGLFYENTNLELTAGLMYNVIGKRIVGIGIRDRSENSTINNDIPDMYEMPRNVFDFTISKRFGKYIEVAAAVKDVLAQPIKYMQFAKFYDATGNLQQRDQIAREYTPGRNIGISAKVKF